MMVILSWSKDLRPCGDDFSRGSNPPTSSRWLFSQIRIPVSIAARGPAVVAGPRQGVPSARHFIDETVTPQTTRFDLSISLN